MKKEDLVFRKFTAIDESIKELELAVGIVFEPNIEPRLIPGTGILLGELPSWNPKGLDKRLKKFYALRVKGLCDFFTPLEGEIYGELVFRKKAKILFGRDGEKKPFNFNKGREHLNLRIYRNGSRFNPLFIRIEDEAEYRLIKMSADWVGDKVEIRFLDPNKAPRFMNV